MPVVYSFELEQVSREFGMILSLDGLAPEGGEPQLWVVRELQTGLTVRSGWLSEQGQHAFENFLRPIAETDLTVRAVLSDKQRGLLPAVNEIFPEARHAFCQLHYRVCPTFYIRVIIGFDTAGSKLKP